VVGSIVGRSGVNAGLRGASRGSTAGARGFCRPTEVPTPGCRSRPAGRPTRGRPRRTVATR